MKTLTNWYAIIRNAGLSSRYREKRGNHDEQRLAAARKRRVARQAKRVLNELRTEAGKLQNQKIK